MSFILVTSYWHPVRKRQNIWVSCKGHLIFFSQFQKELLLGCCFVFFVFCFVLFFVFCSPQVSTALISQSSSDWAVFKLQCTVHLSLWGNHKGLKRCGRSEQICIWHLATATAWRGAASHCSTWWGFIQSFGWCWRCCAHRKTHWS